MLPNSVVNEEINSVLESPDPVAPVYVEVELSSFDDHIWNLLKKLYSGDKVKLKMYIHKMVL